MQFSESPEPAGVGGFLSEASESAETLSRKSCKFLDKSDRFRLKDRNFLRQYAHLYSERLMTMRPKLTEAAKNKWGTSVWMYLWTYCPGTDWLEKTWLSMIKSILLILFTESTQSWLPLVWSWVVSAPSRFGPGSFRPNLVGCFGLIFSKSPGVRYSAVGLFGAPKDLSWI